MDTIFPTYASWPAWLRGGLRLLARDAVRLFDVLAVWRERCRQRRDLGAMDDRMLADIGISRAAGIAEAEKPFWRP